MQKATFAYQLFLLSFLTGFLMHEQKRWVNAPTLLFFVLPGSIFIAFVRWQGNLACGCKLGKFLIMNGYKTCSNILHIKLRTTLVYSTLCCRIVGSLLCSGLLDENLQGLKTRTAAALFNGTTNCACWLTQWVRDIMCYNKPADPEKRRNEKYHSSHTYYPSQ